ncbi:MAG: hypothetical protein ACSHYB_18480 [Roseibacillus sp.]
MKRLIPLCLLAVLPASALEERTFHSADKSKSFVGEAIGYSSKSDTVTVLRDNGSEVKFKVSLLCEEDQTYIRENGVVLAAASATTVQLKEFEGERQSTRSDTMRSAVTPTGYTINVLNGSGEVMEDVTANYTIYYRKGTNSGKGKITEKTGSLDLYTIYPKKRSEGFSSTVSLERVSTSKSGGG